MELFSRSRNKLTRICYKDTLFKINELVKRHAAPQIQQALGVSWDKLMESGAKYEYFMQKLTDIHLHSHLDYEIQPNGNYSYIIIFSIIAIGILLVACVNFVNLATARSANRAKEVGIRKTVGSSREQLIIQFLVETLFMTFLAVFIAIILVMILLPSFNMMAGKQLEFLLFQNGFAIAGLVGLIFVVGLLSGLYR